MNIQEIIAKKRDKQELSKDEITYFVKGYTRGEITDYHAAALVMAIYLNGMTDEETTNLAVSMAASGDILDLSKIPGTIVDKHSTGRSRRQNNANTYANYSKPWCSCSKDVWQRTRIYRWNSRQTRINTRL